MGAPNIKWCEETLCQWISEPYNTWSNLGYIFLAFILIALSRKNNDSSDVKLLGPIILFMGLTSFFYHMSNFYGSQILDFVGMFFFVGWALGVNLKRLGRLQNLGLFLVLFAIANTIIMHVMYLYSVKFQLLILLTGISILLTERNRSSRWFILSICSFIVAFLFSISDAERILCDKEKFGLLSYGHAFWHLISTLGVYFLFKHYSSSQSRLSA